MAPVKVMWPDPLANTLCIAVLFESRDFTTASFPLSAGEWRNSGATGSLESALASSDRGSTAIQLDAPPDRYSEWRVHANRLLSFGSSFDQKRLYLFRGGVLHMRQNMRINVERERHAGMSQLFTDDFWGDPRDQ